MSQSFIIIKSAASGAQKLYYYTAWSLWGSKMFMLQKGLELLKFQKLALHKVWRVWSSKSLIFYNDLSLWSSQSLA